MGRILPPARPPRRAPSPEEVERLADSIRRHGLLHPILVRPSGRDYEIVSGLRRFLACKESGMGEVLAVLRPLDDREALELSLAENARRESFTAQERGDLLRRLGEFFPMRPPEELEAWVGPVREGPPVAELPPAPPAELTPVGEEPPARGAAAVWEELEIESVSTETIFRPEAPAELPDDPAAAEDAGPETAEEFPAPSTEEPPPAGAESPPRRRRLIPRVRRLLEKLNRTSELDLELLRGIVAGLFEMFERLPVVEFLDLTYREKPKRCLPRHCLNVAKLAMFVARELGLPREEIELVAVCGILHDAGMLRVNDSVFAKGAALDEREWSQVKGHPVEGALLLTKEAMLRQVVARVAAEHHEKPDGTGYPAGKRNEEIHFYARLMNVVDTYEAMVSPRAYRLPLLPYQAMQIVIDDGAKGMLDWPIVHVFVKAMSMYPIGSYVRLEGGEIARVVRANPEIPERPVIEIVADARRNVLREPVEIDLAVSDPPEFVPVAAPL